jgi:hypothetical protein
MYNDCGKQNKNSECPKGNENKDCIRYFLSEENWC